MSILASRSRAIHGVLDHDGVVRAYERSVLCGMMPQARPATGRIEDVTCRSCLAEIARALGRPAPALPSDPLLRPGAARILLAGRERIIKSEGIDEAARRLARDTIAEARAVPSKRTSAQSHPVSRVRAALLAVG